MWGIFEAVENSISSYHGLPITHNAKECRPTNVDWEKETT